MVTTTDAVFDIRVRVQLVSGCRQDVEAILVELRDGGEIENLRLEVAAGNKEPGVYRIDVFSVNKAGLKDARNVRAAMGG